MSDNFDLKKYLVENKVTTNSKMLNEAEDMREQALAFLEYLREYRNKLKATGQELKNYLKNGNYHVDGVVEEVDADIFKLENYLEGDEDITEMKKKHSKMMNEYFEKESDSLEQAFQKAGIDMSKPITAVKISGHAYSPGYEADDSMQEDPKSFLKKLEVEKAELEEEEGEAVIYDYDAADSYPAKDMNLPSTMVPKLSVMFSDSYEYVIYQEEGMTEMKKKHSKMMKEASNSDRETIEKWYHRTNFYIDDLSPEEIEKGIQDHYEEWTAEKSKYSSIEDYFADVERNSDWY